MIQTSLCKQLLTLMHNFMIERHMNLYSMPTKVNAFTPQYKPMFMLHTKACHPVNPICTITSMRLPQCVRVSRVLCIHKLLALNAIYECIARKTQLTDVEKEVWRQILWVLNFNGKKFSNPISILLHNNSFVWIFLSSKARKEKKKNNYFKFIWVEFYWVIGIF